MLLYINFQDVNSAIWDVSHTKLDGNMQELSTPWKKNAKPSLLYIIKPRKKPLDSELKQRNKLKPKYIKIKIRIFKQSVFLSSYCFVFLHSV